MLNKPASNIDEFIASYPASTQKLLNQLRKTIHKACPNLEEAMAYGIPTFRLNKKNLVHFSGYEKHIGFYPGAAGIAHFMPEFKGLNTSKGTVQFPIEKGLPLELVTRMVKWCADQALQKQSVKPRAGSQKTAVKAKKATVKRKSVK